MTRHRVFLFSLAWGAFLTLLLLVGVPAPTVGLLTVPLLGLVTAIDPTSRAPGVGIKINLRSGPSSAAGGEFRVLLVSTKNATGGTATVETLYESVANADAVGTLFGLGGLAHLTAQRFFEEYPAGRLDAIAMAAASGDTADGDITLDDATPVSKAQTIEYTICGRTWADVVWEVGETDVAAATKLVAAINSHTRELPVTASNGGGTLAVVTLTFKQKGDCGNDASYRARLLDGTGGSISPTAKSVLTGGTTKPSIANVLTVIADREYRIILPALGNTDVAQASTTGTAGRLKTYISNNDTGIGALLQTGVFACTDSTTAAKAMSGQHDFEYFSHHLIRGGQSLPCEWAGAIAGIYAREFKADPNHPLVRLEFIAELYGTDDIAADNVTKAEQEDLLASGVSYVGYTSGTTPRPRLERPISCYFEDDDGAPDDRILDVSKVYGMIAVGDDLRVLVARTFKGKKLMRSLPSGNTPIPPNVVEEKDAQSLIVGRLRNKWVVDGVILGARLDEVLADGSLIVQVDPTDETQLDVFLPLRVVPPLVKTSIVIVQS